MSTTSDTPTPATVVTTVTQSPSLVVSPAKGVATAPIVGGVLGGIVIAVIAVAMIVPCARRRQRRLRDRANGFGGPRVLRKVVDAEASEPMMQGSWRDHTLFSEDDRMRTTESGHTAIKPAYFERLPVPNFHPPQPVMGEVGRGGYTTSPPLQNPSAPHIPQPTPPSTLQNPRSAAPRFPTLEKLWPLTTAFRTSLASSPSTKTKSSAASSAPSRSRLPSGRGRAGETKPINPDALVSPTVLGREVQLGKGRIPTNMEIKHSNPANEVRYQTAPMHRGFSLQSNPPISPIRREPPTIYAQQRPAYAHNPEPPPLRRQPVVTPGRDRHHRPRGSESSSRPRAHNPQSTTRHHRQISAEHPTNSRPHRSRSRSRSRSDNNASRRPRPDRPDRPDTRRAGSSTTKVYNYTGHPTQR